MITSIAAITFPHTCNKAEKICLAWKALWSIENRQMLNSLAPTLNHMRKYKKKIRNLTKTIIPRKTWILSYSAVTICCSWTREHRPLGRRTIKSTNLRPATASMAALPVSPEVPWKKNQVEIYTWLLRITIKTGRKMKHYHLKVNWNFKKMLFIKLKCKHGC